MRMHALCPLVGSALRRMKKESLVALSISLFGRSSLLTLCLSFVALASSAHCFGLLPARTHARAHAARCALARRRHGAHRDASARAAPCRSSPDASVVSFLLGQSGNTVRKLLRVLGAIALDVHRVVPEPARSSGVNEADCNSVSLAGLKNLAVQIMATTLIERAPGHMYSGLLNVIHTQPKLRGKLLALACMHAGMAHARHGHCLARVASFLLVPCGGH
jgi:hypothetical protein